MPSRICISLPANIQNYLQRLRLQQGYKSMSRFVCRILLRYAEEQLELEEEKYVGKGDELSDK